MKTAFIIHGAFGNPNENWFPWLKSELEKRNYKVFIPKFPTPKNQSLENWLEVFKDYKKNINENTILIGHSIGAAFLLHVLEGLDKPVYKTFLVSGFIDLLQDPVFNEINKSFLQNFKWIKIKNNSNKLYVFHSDNDPYVPLKFAKKLAEALGVELTIIKNAGHFNKAAGYTKFNLLLKKILESYK